MAEREHEPHGDGPLVLLHQFASDVVNGGNVIRIDGVAEAEAVSEKGRAEKDREAVKGCEGPAGRTRRLPWPWCCRVGR
jgi:hypothetical protein